MQPQTVQPFEYIKLGYSLIIEESRERRRGEPLGGSGGILPHKNLQKSWSSKTPFLVCWEENFCLKCCLNWLSFLCLFFLHGFLYRYLIYFIFWMVFKVFWMSVWVSILCYVFLYNSQKNSLENITTELCQNWDFSYPTRIFIGILDFQAKLGGSQRDWGGWTVCNLPVLLTSFELASPINVCLFL